MKLLRLFIFIALTLLSNSHAKANDDATTMADAIAAFGTIPIMHQGRVKPMDSFARAVKKQLSGTEDDALIWLAETIFNPARGEHIPVLKINNPAVINMLQLPRPKTKLYNYQTVSNALLQRRDIVVSVLDTKIENWTPAQRDLVKLQKQVVLLGDLLSSLSLFLPLSVPVPESIIPNNEEPLTYVDSLDFANDLRQAVTALAESKGQNIDTYSADEQQILHLSFALAGLKERGLQSQIFRVFPTNDRSPWISPWQFLTSGASGPQTADLFKQWQDMSQAYHMQKSNMLRHYSDVISQHAYFDPDGLRAELYYNQLQPLKLSFLLYCLSLALLVSYFYHRKTTALSLALAGLYVGAALHFIAITLRIYILGRPPVSTLYESIIFAGFVAVITGIFAYNRNQKIVWLYITGLLGAALHLVGFSNGGDGDDFLMLTAVLNTNFWLATHVICITIGYAFCILTSALAHYAFANSIFEKKALSGYTDLFKSLKSFALISLLFTAVGTVLGGIWADQSWGRFWGWDPKENGAFLIVLWLIWIIHGRISGQMTLTAYTAGLAFLSAIVAISWFGVNLLGVGLHSYGFTDGAALSLIGFIVFEMILIGGLTISARRYHKGKP